MYHFKTALIELYIKFENKRNIHFLLQDSIVYTLKHVQEYLIFFKCCRKMTYDKPHDYKNMQAMLKYQIKVITARQLKP